MTGLVTACCFAAALPLLAGLFLAGSALDRLARHSDALVQDGVLVAQRGAVLRDELRDLNRNAEQFLVLGDPVLLDVMRDRERGAQATLAALEQDGPRPEAQALRASLNDALRAWKASLSGAVRPAQAVAQFAALVPAAEEVVNAGQAAIDRQVVEIGEATRTAHRVTALCAVALVPLTALFAYGFSRVIVRPMRQLAAGINALGHGRYDQPVAVTYPQEMHELGDRVDWLRERTGALEAEKDRFLRHISHELKTPLATLQEGSALMRDASLGPLTPQQSEVAHILGDAAYELGTLITNLLSYAEWKQGERRPGMAWFETAPMISEVLLAHQLSLSRRRLSVRLGEIAPRLYGQRARLRVALDNLVGNAIKHAPDGSVIDVGALRAAGVCELRVRDRGRGVAPEEKDRIFEPFVRGSEAEESAVRGTGIGLSIVRETALAHEGNVEVLDAQPGASFRIVWPCPAEPGAAARG